jgi:hypothetical protein
MLTACAQAEQDIKCCFSKWQQVLFQLKIPLTYTPVDDISTNDIVANFAMAVKPRFQRGMKITNFSLGCAKLEK